MAKIRRVIVEIKKRPYGYGNGTVSILRLSCEHQIMRINGHRKVGDHQTCAICTDPNSPDALDQRIFTA
jgi:hypothetical protein